MPQKVVKKEPSYATENIFNQGRPAPLHIKKKEGNLTFVDSEEESSSRHGGQTHIISPSGPKQRGRGRPAHNQTSTYSNPYQEENDEQLMKTKIREFTIDHNRGSEFKQFFNK